MASLGKKGLDLSGVGIFGAKVLLPAGSYNAKCVSADIKDTKAGGKMIVAKFSVLDGEFSGAEVDDMFNIVNDNADAVRIGFSKIKAVLTHGGHSNPNKIGDTDELVGLSVGIVVSVEERSFTNDKGENIDFKQNKVEGFKAISNETAPAKPAAPKKEAEQPKVEEKKVEESAPSEFPWG